MGWYLYYDPAVWLEMADETGQSVRDLVSHSFLQSCGSRGRTGLAAWLPLLLLLDSPKMAPMLLVTNSALPMVKSSVRSEANWLMPMLAPPATRRPRMPKTPEMSQKIPCTQKKKMQRSACHSLLHCRLVDGVKTMERKM